MLLRFRFSNFRSFRDEQELSLVASPLSERREAVITSPAVTDGILPVAAIYGANASGKSNVLKAFEFALNAIKGSFTWPPEGGAPYEPFALVQRSDARPSQFVLDLLIDGVRYQYGFALDGKGVISEWLHVFPRGRKQVWFDRRLGQPIAFGRTMSGENAVIEEMTRPNCLFLSAAAQANHKVLTVVYTSIASPLVLVDRTKIDMLRIIANVAVDSEYALAHLRKMLRIADLGISQVKALAHVSATLPPRFEFTHVGRGDAVFGEAQESDGTLAYLSLAHVIGLSVGLGQLVAVDEIDRSLHPVLARSLIQLFMDRKTNPRGAQLIFNTHDTNLLTGDLLRRDQIWFTEKDSHGASHLYPLTDFKPRKGENLESGYLQGRYGAVPFLNPTEIVSGPSNQNGKKTRKKRSR